MKISLYVVSTPIGNLQDLSERARYALGDVDAILCEDTRVAAKLLQSIGIKNKLIIYNDHNATLVIPKIIDTIKNEQKVYALISDAGTPLVSDPGYKLVNACIENEISYTHIPGACSVISALVLSGLPSNRFLFDGFVDEKKFDALSKIDSTIILFESPHRLVKSLKNMKLYFADRVISIVREITKIFEESIRGDLDYLIDHFEKTNPRGEIVIVISPPTKNIDMKKLQDLDPLIESMLGKISTKEISEILSKYSGVSKNKIYNFILEFHSDKS